MRILPYDPRRIERVGREDGPPALLFLLRALEDVIRVRGRVALLVQGSPKGLPVGGERIVQPERPALGRGVWKEREAVDSVTQAICMSASKPDLILLI